MNNGLGVQQLSSIKVLLIIHYAQIGINMCLTCKYGNNPFLIWYNEYEMKYHVNFTMVQKY